jgi:phosphoenolpyruvate-protein phosphotransferase (PTS system enzyme I)
VQPLTGIGVSPGVVVGRAVLFTQKPRAVRFSLGPDRIESELARLDEARTHSRRQLRDIMARMSGRVASELGHLFEAQLLMLDDPMLVSRAVELVRAEHVNVEWAVQRAFDELSAVFDEIQDPYLRERRGDVADVVGRLIMNLRKGRSKVSDLFRDLDEPSILIAEDLPPSLAGQFDWSMLAGFATDVGSRTYHTAILARSLKLPAVVGLGDASRRIPPGALVVLDGTSGEVIVDPTPSVLERLNDRRQRWIRYERSLVGSGAVPAVTTDGVAIRLEANIELPDDLTYAREHGAEGVGLYRSEFLTASSPGAWMTEDLQYRTYRALLEHMAPGPVTIRTFDMDATQLRAASTQNGPQNGPIAGGDTSGGPLGLRAIRLSLASPEMFRTQLRALLRAAHHGRLRVMFPFVSSLEELRQAKLTMREVAAELAQRGEAPPKVQVGVMIEIPSAALTADLLARESDFLSIGTNDLIQYCLAVDRHDAAVSGLYEPLHPAILRTIRQVQRAAARAGIPLAVCGEMASDPALIPLLIGLGITELSMNPASIPLAKQVVRGVSAAGLRRVAAHALRLSTVEEIQRYLMSRLGDLTRLRTFPEGEGMEEGAAREE